MNADVKKLTSVENEYLEKCGKKRRQKTIIDEIEFNNDTNKEVKNITNIMDKIDNKYQIKNENEINHSYQIKDIKQISSEKSNNNDNNEYEEIKSSIKINEEESEDDYDTLEVIRQLSSIHIESDNDNDKEKKAYNKKENKNIKIKKNKNNKNKRSSLIFDISEIECVEDAVIYDESKDTIFPDLKELFSEYNVKYFFNKLETVEVKWSNKMKLCAGICIFKKSGYCCIRLSLPLLKLRKIKEYRETLLHEMIHAFLFLTRKNSIHDGHGPEFKKHMYRINKATGLSITIYHSFHDEVNFYRNHIWRCTGVCRTYPPHFGYVRRSMNRPPSSKEKWWRRHSLYCGGHFVKINEKKSTTNEKSGDMNKKGDFKIRLENILDKKTNNKKDNVEFEKRDDNMEEDMINDEIIILDSPDDLKEKKPNEEIDIIDLIKNLFSDNKEKILSFPDITVDYHKAFKSQKYFEIDSDN
ncbi:conserved Plasmodium protein, unknown function [Plasmodium gallinaceum]|uniref:SprT-like domain-containing protein n=1 Tax=Plasmodium gallinaceum TaxID=5849 RepID=A0A1J1GS42_PLAGA|nr:conserved Plasmodium protein, unknown function [Plasmodium gallinaceum]CRG95094.1 conserved Plasmodium protein, unknown function [Plasmodium gallinaceum]